MISVLVPSRGRPQLLADSIKSLGPGVEVLVRLDDDDPTLDEYSSDQAYLIGPPLGYKNFHVMVNELAAQATGDYLMLWNDDAVMMTPDWLAQVEATIHPDIAVLNFSPVMVANLFPIITRRMYDVMGHYSLSAHCDSWVQDIANQLGIHHYVPGVEIKHLRDMVWDDTKMGSQAAYAETSPLHYSPEMQALMQADIEKLNKEL